MREILFRGKRTDNGEWVEGSLVGYFKGKSASIFESKSKAYHPVGTTTFCSTSLYDVDPSTVGQYTGLKDKNGKKIFEGDILEGHFDEDFPENITLVEVIWKEYGFYTKEVSAGAEPLEEADGEIYEVIGNIHDNPELLEGGDK